MVRRLQSGNNNSQDYDGDAERSAPGHLLFENENAHDKDPHEAGRRDAGHDGYRHMDQGHLVDHQRGKQKTIRDNDARIQKFGKESALFGFCDIGLLFKNDLTQRGDKRGRDSGSVTKRGSKKF